MAKAWKVVEAMHRLREMAKDDRRIRKELSVIFPLDLYPDYPEYPRNRALRLERAANKLEAKLRNSRLVWR